MKYKVPASVQQRIKAQWGDKPAERQHAAKQALCWLLDAGRIFKQDHDAVVNYGILTGYIAASTEIADIFIDRFEQEVSKSWFGVKV